jgi:hypothetical protein
MAWIEAAVVVYLRRIHYPDNPLVVFPLRAWPASELLVEVVREAATIVMILAVALLSVPGRTRRTAAFLYIFGVWDLCYYLWLKVMIGWPVSWTEWDILFLIPWPWLAPWLTPALVALLFTLWSGGVLGRKEETAVPRRAVLLAVAGLLLVLASFLEPALGIPGGIAAGAGSFVPTRFPWAAYLPGMALLAAGLFIARPGRIATSPVAAPPSA